MSHCTSTSILSHWQVVHNSYSIFFLFLWLYSISCVSAQVKLRFISFFFFFFINLFYLFIYSWLCWVFIAACACGLSPVAASGGHPSPRCTGLSLRRPLLLRSTGSRHAGFSSCGCRAQALHRPSRSAACGILPDQASNPCPLHRQADSQPLHHQGSPLGSSLACTNINIVNSLLTSLLTYALMRAIFSKCKSGHITTVLKFHEGSLCLCSSLYL